MRRLILESHQSPGDILMLTAAVRDLHRACPGQFQTDVRTSADELWENNPHITRLQQGMTGVETIRMHYPLIHQSNQRPYHFIHGYAQYLEQQLNVRIPITDFRADLHLSESEKRFPPAGMNGDLPRRFWIIVAGGKYDFTAKWWNPQCYQEVVNHFRGRIQFVQCGASEHWHPSLDGAVNFVGKTSLRDFIRLMHHADGVVCPVTFAMHLAAAVETAPGRPRNRACVVVAGGREPPHWEAYPHHQFISTNGALSCCSDGGCWKSRCQKVGDGDRKDRRDLCEKPVDVAEELSIPRCMDLIRSEDVIRRIEMYYEGGALNGRPSNGRPQPAEVRSETREPVANGKTPVLLEFRHGLGDAVQLSVVLRHLQEERPDWDVDVAALHGKHSASRGLCCRSLVFERDKIPRSEYAQIFDMPWHECRSSYAEYPSTKASRCLIETFAITPRPDLCRYQIEIGEDAASAARNYLSSIIEKPSGDDSVSRLPTVLIHYEGNTSSAKKNLSHTVIEQLVKRIRHWGLTPVILDWDRRSPLVKRMGVANPGADHPIWSGHGTGDTEVIAALIAESTAVVGIDSGPLHVAGATSTPTLGVWTHHHPIHYFDLAPNVVHLVPERHERLANGPDAIKFFQENYRSVVYHNLSETLLQEFETLLSKAGIRPPAHRVEGPLEALSFGVEYYEEHKAAGLDYCQYTDWQAEYGRWLVEGLDLSGKNVLDVGCACGAQLRGLAQAGAIGHGIDVNEHTIRLGREAWRDLASALHICDTVNAHLFADESFDFIHAHQVSEHWRPQLVPFILRELHRIAKPNALFWSVLDTEELALRQNRDFQREDPTHVCIKPIGWWTSQLRDSGWVPCLADETEKLRAHNLSFLRRYDWDWFLARKI